MNLGRVLWVAVTFGLIAPLPALGGQAGQSTAGGLPPSAEPIADPSPSKGSSCPGTTTEPEIIVCGRREDGDFRVGPFNERWDPNGVVDSVLRERRRMLEVGDAGIHSCSTVGPAGWTGCTFKRWREAQEQNPNRITTRPGVPTIRIGRIAG